MVKVDYDIQYILSMLRETKLDSEGNNIGYSSDRKQNYVIM